MKLFLTIWFLFPFVACFAGTIEVGKNKSTSSLKKAIASANHGDTILLHNGIYKEGTLVIDKPLFLIGLGQPVLDGESKYEILVLTGQHIVIKGIHFRNSGYSSMNDLAAIKIIDAANVVIENNLITNSFFAIHIANATYTLVTNNTIKGSSKTEHSAGNGIHLWKCENMLIDGNHIEGHRDGIYFEFVTHSIIQNNRSTRNIRYGLHFMFSHNDAYIANTFKENGAGVAVMYSRQVLMMKNHFDRNWGPSAYGLLLKEITDSRIHQNIFDQNTVGIMMEGSNRIEVLMNVFSSNGWAVKVQASCSENAFRCNNFLANTFDIATNGSMMLNHFSRNFWDKYEGYDRNRDKIGDIPYHPVSMYAMVIEQNPNSLLLLRSFMVSLLEKAEKAIPSLTPENLFDGQPLMHALKL